MTQAVLPDIVHVTLPDGEQGTVPKEDLAQAVAAGAHLQTDAEGDPLGSLGGKALSALFGAGRSATFGGSDLITSGAAGLIGGESARKDVLSGMSRLKEANPYSDMAGQFGGLLLGGGGISAAGHAAEAGAAGLVGEGLLGKMAIGAARMGVEGAGIGAQQAISEDVLGDHELNGQKIFASAAKDGLIGAIGGAGFGAAGYGLGKVRGLFASKPGPIANKALDEIAGGGSVEAAVGRGETYVDAKGVTRYVDSGGVVLDEPTPGIGQAVRADAQAAEDLVDNLRKRGATEAQASEMADGVQRATSEAAGGESLPWEARAYKGARRAIGGRDEGMEEILDRGYGDRATRLAKQDEITNQSAAKMAKSLTGTLRNAEDTVNEAQFTQKSGQFAKLVDTTKTDLQRDAVASLLQDADETLKFWEGTASKGGAEGAVKSLRRTWQDALDSMAKVDNDATPTMSRDLYIKTDNLKRAIDKTLGWGRENRFGMPEAIRGVGPDGAYGLEPLANKFRSALESEETWGQAGPAQARWNGSFSDLKARRDHLTDQLGVAIDQKAGLRIREGDFAKVRGMLNSLAGDSTDSMLQPVKSAEAFVDGMRNRVAAIREFAELTPAQDAKLTQGLKDLSDFESSFADARKEAGIMNRLKRQQLQEQGKGVGGLIGLIGDLSSKPLTTMERLASVRHTAETVKDGISRGVKSLFGGEGAGVKVPPVRPKADVAKEIGDIRELAGNPAALEERVQQMVGDLSTHAPKTADEVKMTAKRAIYYLAKEAPIGGITIGLMGTHGQTPRFSDQQLSEWEAKRNAVLGTDSARAPDIMLADMRNGKLNREAIKAAEFVSPKLFAEMQQTAQEEIRRMDAKGLLDKMPYQQKAAIASLLKVPADGTWRPDFIALMQAGKGAPPPPTQSGPAPQNSGRKADKPTANMWMTEAGSIESKGEN